MAQAVVNLTTIPSRPRRPPIDWFLTPTLAVFQLYRGVIRNPIKEFRLHFKIILFQLFNKHFGTFMNSCVFKYNLVIDFIFIIIKCM
jgi:hypothetical protein